MPLTSMNTWIHELPGAQTFDPGGRVVAEPGPPGLWTVAWRGYGDGGRCTVWVVPDEQAAWKFAADAINDSYLDAKDRKLLALYKAGQFEEMVRAWGDGREFPMVHVTPAPFVASYSSEPVDPRR